MNGVSEPEPETTIDRRQLIGGSLFLAALIGIPLYKFAASTNAGDGATDRQRAVIRQVSQIVIPRTDTPGAGDAGVGDFVILALAHGLLGTGEPPKAKPGPPQTKPVGQNNFIGVQLDYLRWLENTLDTNTEADWLAASPQRQAEVLTALDVSAFPPGPPPSQPSPWVAIKALILTGHYTSEVGGSTELAYELVPGRFDPDIPLTADMRAWSSDWTAVEFG